MMRLPFGAVLLSLQLCIAAAIAQSENDIVSCYTECRDDIQASVDGWECSGSQECNCRTDGYLERLGCCMQDLCDTPSQAVFRIPCSPSDDDEDVWFSEASCPATTSTASTASSTATDRVGINAITSSAEEETTMTTESDSSTATSTTSTASDPSSTDDSLAADSDSSSDSSSDNSLALGLGLGLGIPLSLAVAGLLAFLFYRARQRRKTAEADAAAAASNDPRQQSKDGKINPFASPEPPIYELSSAGPNAEPLPPNELPTQADDAMDAIPTHTEYPPPSRSTSSAAASVVTEKKSIVGGRQTPDVVTAPGRGPRTWDSQSTLASLPAPASGNDVQRPMSTVPSRSVRSLPSRSVRSMTSEMLMRDLPDLPPTASARQGARSPEIKTISELP